MNKHKQCPECGKRLTLINSSKLPDSPFYIHVWPLNSLFDLVKQVDKCPYSEKVKA